MKMTENKELMIKHTRRVEFRSCAAVVAGETARLTHDLQRSAESQSANGQRAALHDGTRKTFAVVGILDWP